METREMVERVVGEDVRVEWRLTPEIAPVKADRSQLEQVWLNLVLNARDAMPGGGRLSVATAPADAAAGPCGSLGPGDHVVLSVSDSGTGMTPEVRERIFEPFFTTKAEGKGTGLGLATVFGIVRQHGGCIGVESEPGAGTVFRVFLPTTDAEPERGLDGGQADAVRGTEGVSRSGPCASGSASPRRGSPSARSIRMPASKGSSAMKSRASWRRRRSSWDAPGRFRPTPSSSGRSGASSTVLAPYHDVGMTAIKVAAFGRAVNVTLGLPFPRTSPDHGTALDIAGSGRADPASMQAALRLAVDLAGRR